MPYRLRTPRDMIATLGLALCIIAAIALVMGVIIGLTVWVHPLAPVGIFGGVFLGFHLLFKRTG